MGEQDLDIFFKEKACISKGSYTFFEGKISVADESKKDKEISEAATEKRPFIRTLKKDPAPTIGLKRASF